MPQLVVIGVLALLFVVFAVLKSVFGEAGDVRRRLAGTPLTTIRDAPLSGLAHIAGTASVPGEALIAPLSQRRCAVYEAVVEQYRSQGKTGAWHVIIRERRGVPFALTDGTGRALVDPTQMRIDLQRDHASHSGSFDDATPVEEAFLARHLHSSTGVLFNKSLRYREAVLEVGERATVVGNAMREPDPDPDSAQGAEHFRAAPMRLRISGSAEMPVFISDEPGVAHERPAARAASEVEAGDAPVRVSAGGDRGERGGASREAEVDAEAGGARGGERREG